MMKTIIYLFFLSLLLLGCSFGNGNIVIIPKNFKGYIVVIYDQKSGVLPQYQGKKQIYEIPQNGILKVQNEIDTDWRERTEFYYEKISSKNELPSFDSSQKIPTGTTIGFEGSSGGANKDYEGKNVVRFSLFYIGNKSEIEKYKEQAEKLDIVKLAE